jgi:hypothetical protein
MFRQDDLCVKIMNITVYKQIAKNVFPLRAIDDQVSCQARKEYQNPGGFKHNSREQD